MLTPTPLLKIIELTRKVSLAGARIKSRRRLLPWLCDHGLTLQQIDALFYMVPSHLYGGGNPADYPFDEAVRDAGTDAMILGHLGGKVEHCVAGNVNVALRKIHGEDNAWFPRMETPEEEYKRPFRVCTGDEYMKMDFEALEAAEYRRTAHLFEENQ